MECAHLVPQLLERAVDERLLAASIAIQSAAVLLSFSHCVPVHQTVSHHWLHVQPGTRFGESNASHVPCEQPPTQHEWRRNGTSSPC